MRWCVDGVRPPRVSRKTACLEPQYCITGHEHKERAYPCQKQEIGRAAVGRYEERAMHPVLNNLQGIVHRGNGFFSELLDEPCTQWNILVRRRISTVIARRESEQLLLDRRAPVV